MNATDTQLPIFFIIGRPRSGTTLLRTLFDAHPNVNIPLECAYINNLYQRYGKIKKADRSLINDFIQDLKGQSSFEFWKTEDAAVEAALMKNDVNLDFAGLCKAVCNTYRSAFPKKEIMLLGDKNPVYAFYTAKLMKIFPDARFILLTRDYRDHVASVLKLKLSYRNIAQIVWQWKWTFAKNRKIAQRFPGHFYTVSYEDFVASPQAHFREMCTFLHIPYEEGVFEFYSNTQARDSMYTDGFLRQWQQHLFEPISTSNAGRWKQELSKEQIKMADAVAGKWAEKAGYERVYKKTGPAYRLTLAPRILIIWLFDIKRRIKDRVVFKKDNSE